MQVVQVIVNNPANGPHPFHLHGHDFWVLGKGAWNDGIFQTERESNVGAYRTQERYSNGRRKIVGCDKIYR